MATIICSHGFGVRADARGMFTELAEKFPEYDFVTFDYNQVDSDGNLIVAPLEDQVRILQTQLDAHPGVILLAHSQGCLVAALADLSTAAQIIFLAPPVETSMQRVIDKLMKKPGAEINLNGYSKLPRTDGSTTLISRDYMESLERLNPLALYQNVVDSHPTVIIRALNDTVLGMTNVDEIKGAQIIDIPADHDFQGQSRQLLVDKLCHVLC